MDKMNLDNFESYIDPKILARGKDYYKNDCVTSAKEIDDNIYEAEVEGSDLYTVEVELDDEENIMDTQCDCPYDMGNFCKHQVAVFFALRDRMTINTRTSKMPINDTVSGSVPKSPAKKKKTSDIKELLADRSKDELIEFLLDIASEYKEIKKRIELNFDDGDDESELAKSIALIHTYIKKISDRNGYLAYGDADYAVKGADMVLEKAHFALKNDKVVHAVNLALCVINEMIDLLQMADDSDGVIGGVIEESFDVIREVVIDEDTNPVDKETIFDRLLKESTNRLYEGWTDWRLALLGNCSGLADAPVLRSKLEDHLVSIIKNEKGDSWSSNYFSERINLIRYGMIEEQDGHEKAQEFIEQNLQYSNFRKMAIESAIDEKKYDIVIKLTLGGEEQDKSMRGLVSDWRKYRYKAYQLSGRRDEQREIAMDFILDGSFEYYKELKSTYDDQEWPSVYPQIIIQLESRKKTNQDIYTRILIEEDEKQKLLAYVKGNPFYVEHYYKYLLPTFKDEVYALFLQHIEHSAADASDRRAYQGVCAIIWNLKKVGGKSEAQEITQKLTIQYAKRPAFRDELSKL